MASDIRFDINGVYKINTDEARALLGKLTKEAESLFMKKDVPLTKHVKELTQTLQQEDGTVKKVTRTFVQYRNELGRIVDAQGKLQRNSKGQFTNENNWQMVSEKTSIALNKEAQRVTELDEALKSLNTELGKTTKENSNLDLSFRSLGETLVKVAKFKIVTEILMSFINAGNEAVQIVKDFDSALTEFKKVSDLSGQSLDDYTEKLGDLGSEVARTTTEMVEGATAFRKSGYSDEDSAQLAKISAIFQNIADEELDASESAQILISTMKGFDLGVESAEHVADVINEVSNRFSVSSSDISSGLANVSAVSNMAKNSIEETTGMLTAMVEISQSAGKSSRGLRQIITRLTQTLDENSSTGQKLKDIYAELGIEITDQNGNLRSTYDILSELAQQWDTLSVNQQQYIALTSAGANQIQNFVALMQNFEHASEATTVALGSQGSAMKENSRYMESIDA